MLIIVLQELGAGAGEIQNFGERMHPSSEWHIVPANGTIKEATARAEKS
jgi:hypothetical protein